MLYSASSPKKFVKWLTEYLKKSDGVVELDDKIWKLTYTVDKELDDE